MCSLLTETIPEHRNYRLYDLEQKDYVRVSLGILLVSAADMTVLLKCDFRSAVDLNAIKIKQFPCSPCIDFLRLLSENTEVARCYHRA